LLTSLLLMSACSGLLLITSAIAETTTDTPAEGMPTTTAEETAPAESAKSAESMPKETEPALPSQQPKLVWPSEKDAVISEMPGMAGDTATVGATTSGETTAIDPDQPNPEEKSDHE